MKNKHVCLHLHFDLPPLENPWLGAVEPEPSAAPHGDSWESYYHSCVGPQLAAGLLDENGRLLRTANNLLSVSFSFAPALLEWLERREARAYRKIIEADARSAASRGHGNAVMCPHPSLVLPSASPSDKRAALSWGLADFRRRFGREPEALWAPEGSADADTLSAAAGLGLRLALMSPPGGIAEAGLRRPWRWSGAGRSLAVFFFDPGLSRAAAGGTLAAGGGGRFLANRLAERFRADAGAEFLLVAADARDFSRELGGERSIARAFDAMTREASFQPANPAQYLGIFPPPQELALPAAPPGAHDKAGPLREAAQRLASHIGAEARAALRRLLNDPDKAFEGWLEGGLRPDGREVEGFLERQGAGTLSPHDRERALALLDALRARLEMLCAPLWPGGSPPPASSGSQALLLAAFALDALERATGNRGLREGFAAELTALPSPDPQDSGAARTFERLILNCAASPERLAAHAAVMDHIRGTLGLPRPLQEPWPAFEVSVSSLRRLRLPAVRGERLLSVSRVFIRRAGLRRQEGFLTAVAQGVEPALDCRLAADPGEAEASGAAAELQAAFEEGEGAFREAADRLFGRERQGLDALFPAERRRAIAEISPPPGPRGQALARWRDALQAQAGGPDIQILIDAVLAAREAGLPADSLPDVGCLRGLAREAAWGFAEEGAIRLPRFFAVFRAAVRCGLSLPAWELEACALEGLRRMSEESSLFERILAAPPGSVRDVQERISKKVFEQEAREIAAAFAVSPAVMMNAPAQESAARGEAP